MTGTRAIPTDRLLYERTLATAIACWEHFAAATDGAGVIRAPGVAAAVFPSGRERAVYNNAVLERDLRPNPSAMRGALDIRLARANDLDGLVVLWERSVRATHGFLSEQDIVDLRPQVRDALGHDELELWVLGDADDTPMGFLGLSGNDISALFLDPAARNRGAGRRLIAHAQSLREGELTVDVNEQNPAAVGFYEALGFVVVGRSPLDDEGRPFPLLHMRRAAPPAASRDESARASQ